MDGIIPLGAQASADEAPPPSSGTGTSSDPRPLLASASENLSGAKPRRASDIHHVSCHQRWTLSLCPAYFGVEESSQWE